jgi:hypothetical protein
MYFSQTVRNLVFLRLSDLPAYHSLTYFRDFLVWCQLGSTLVKADAIMPGVYRVYMPPSPAIGNVLLFFTDGKVAPTLVRIRLSHVRCDFHCTYQHQRNATYRPPRTRSASSTERGTRSPLCRKRSRTRRGTSLPTPPCPPSPTPPPPPRTKASNSAPLFSHVVRSFFICCNYDLPTPSCNPRSIDDFSLHRNL